MWRISFSAAEKEIILYSDGTLRSTSQVTHRKAVLRLLKDDVEQYNKGKSGDRKTLCSYHVKMAFLHYLDRVARDDDWTDEESNIRMRYVEAVKLLIEKLQEGNLPHYFMDKVNTLEESGLTKAELKRAIKYFNDIIMRYATLHASGGQLLMTPRKKTTRRKL